MVADNNLNLKIYATEVEQLYSLQEPTIINRVLKVYNNLKNKSGIEKCFIQKLQDFFQSINISTSILNLTLTLKFFWSLVSFLNEVLRVLLQIQIVQCKRKTFHSCRNCAE